MNSNTQQRGSDNYDGHRDNLETYLSKPLAPGRLRADVLGHFIPLVPDGWLLENFHFRDTSVLLVMVSQFPWV